MALSGNKYFDLSSDNDSEAGGSFSSSDDEEDFMTEFNSTTLRDDPLWGRTILHLDVDCFYLQAEEIERGLRENGKSIPPMAIGQKHIIVSEFSRPLYKRYVTVWQGRLRLE